MSERSEKNTSCFTLSAARSSLIATIIMAMALVRTSGSHLASSMAFQRVAELGLQRLADRLEIIARIEALGDVTDVLAERLAVAQERGTRQHIDLGAGIVDVVLARHPEAGEGQQIGQRVAEHRAAAVADMHRAGRVGRDVFDVDRLAGADGALAVIRAGRGSRRPAPRATPTDRARG